jgi:DNA-binding NarL/FixJ family response regulator
MKRVLFVDDEPKALEDLKLMLQLQEFPWKAGFAGSGKSALDLLGEKAFDVIISDIRMPEMDGAALLKIVCERFPGAVRIVVRNQEEMNGALRAVPVAHQFLLKPCEPHMLRVAVERATSLSDVLSNKMLASIVGSVKDLPVLPRTFMALREKLADPNASVKEVVKLVEQDISISAKILQLVNSAFFGLPREISTTLCYRRRCFAFLKTPQSCRGFPLKNCTNILNSPQRSRSTFPCRPPCTARRWSQVYCMTLASWFLPRARRSTSLARWKAPPKKSGPCLRSSRS